MVKTAVFTILLLLSGCATAILTAKDAKEMSPEQIKAYSDAGADVYQCFKLSGPPPLGGISVIVVPKGANFEFSLGPNCSLLTGKVTP